MSLCCRIVLGWLLILAVTGCGAKAPQFRFADSEAPSTEPAGVPSACQARFVRKIDWIGHGHWLKADLHTHTKFSDGSHSVAEIVDKAASFQCNVVAITDHGGSNLFAATPPYFKEIAAARLAHPEMIVLTGLEWNVPPWEGDEHAKVLLASERDEASLLTLFKANFDDFDRAEHDSELADEALRWLAEYGTVDGLAPVVLYNHPSRKRGRSTSLVPELTRMRQVNELVVGFEGGAGHQRTDPLGGYQTRQQLIDRWDPVVARAGDGWDQLLAAGIDVWGAEASSDFHNADPRDLHDYWPGEFSETWLYVPEKTATGVLQALRAGSFFGVHGQIAREVQIRVDADSLPRPAQAGEAIAVSKGCVVSVEVRYDSPPTDWEGKPNQLDSIELIAIDESGAELILTHQITPESPTLKTALEPLGKSLVLRARGRRVVPDGPDLMFYTNPVRINVE
jgi:hypothetical protein